MDNDKILELARRHGVQSRYIDCIAFTEKEIIAFAQSIIEAQRDTTTIKVPTVVWDKLKDVNTVTDLIKALKAAEE